MFGLNKKVSYSHCQKNQVSYLNDISQTIKLNFKNQYYLKEAVPKYF